MLKILLHGAAGKMGHMVAACAAQMEDVQIACGVDARTEEENGFPMYCALGEVAVEFDIIIDFSHASTLDSLLDFAVSRGKPCVIASTGHSDTQKKMIAAASSKIPVFYSANFSLGVNVLMTLCRKAATALGGFDIEIVEKHHNQKVDAPSGTALMLADTISSVLNDAPDYVYSRHELHSSRGKNEIGISAVRGGTIVGEHDVIFAGYQEVVTLSHTAYSREVFANGALRAAKFLKLKSVGLFNMESMIEECIG